MDIDTNITEKEKGKKAAKQIIGNTDLGRVFIFFLFVCLFRCVMGVFLLSLYLFKKITVTPSSAAVLITSITT